MFLNCLMFFFKTIRFFCILQQIWTIVPVSKNQKNWEVTGAIIGDSLRRSFIHCLIVHLTAKNQNRDPIPWVPRSPVFLDFLYFEWPFAIDFNKHVFASLHGVSRPRGPLFTFFKFCVSILLSCPDWKYLHRPLQSNFDNQHKAWRSIRRIKNCWLG